jgi:hypothetical protein
LAADAFLLCLIPRARAASEESSAVTEAPTENQPSDEYEIGPSPLTNPTTAIVVAAGTSPSPE